MTTVRHVTTVACAATGSAMATRAEIMAATGVARAAMGMAGGAAAEAAGTTRAAARSAVFRRRTRCRSPPPPQLTPHLLYHSSPPAGHSPRRRPCYRRQHRVRCPRLSRPALPVSNPPSVSTPTLRLAPFPSCALAATDSTFSSITRRFTRQLPQ